MYVLFARRNKEVERSVEEVIRLAEQGSGEGAAAIPVEPAVKAAFREHFSPRMFQVCVRLHARIYACVWMYSHAVPLICPLSIISTLSPATCKTPLLACRQLQDVLQCVLMVQTSCARPVEHFLMHASCVHRPSWQLPGTALRRCSGGWALGLLPAGRRCWGCRCLQLRWS